MSDDRSTGDAWRRHAAAFVAWLAWSCVAFVVIVELDALVTADSNAGDETLTGVAWWAWAVLSIPLLAGGRHRRFGGVARPLWTLVAAVAGVLLAGATQPPFELLLDPATAYRLVTAIVLMVTLAVALQRGPRALVLVCTLLVWALLAHASAWVGDHLLYPVFGRGPVDDWARGWQLLGWVLGAGIAAAVMWPAWWARLSRALASIQPGPAGARRRDRLLPALAISLVVVTALTGYALMTTKSTLEGLPQPEIALVIGAPAAAESHQAGALTIDTTVAVTPKRIGDCHPADVTVHLDMTKLGLRGASRLALAVTGPGERQEELPKHIGFRYVWGTSETSEIHGTGTPRYLSEPIPRPKYDAVSFPFPSGDPRDQPRTLLSEHRGTLWTTGFVASAPVADWAKLRALEVTFRADWSQRRGMGSCHVLIPRLVGATQATELARNNLGSTTQPYRINVTGVARAMSEGEFSRRDEDADPAPSATTQAPELEQAGATTGGITGRQTGPTWRCRASDGAAVGDVSTAANCSAQIVTSDAALEDFRVFLLFLLAALFSLGLQMIYDLYYKH